MGKSKAVKTPKVAKASKPQDTSAKTRVRSSGIDLFLKQIGKLTALLTDLQVKVIKWAEADEENDSIGICKDKIGAAIETLSELPSEDEIRTFTPPTPARGVLAEGTKVCVIRDKISKYQDLVDDVSDLKSLTIVKSEPGHGGLIVATESGSRFCASKPHLAKSSFKVSAPPSCCEEYGTH